MWKLMAMLGLAVVVAGCDLQNDAIDELMALSREHAVFEVPICGTKASDYQPEKAAGNDFFEDGYIYCKEAFADVTVWPPKFAFGETADGFFIQTRSGKSQRMLARAGINLECFDGGTQSIKRPSLINDAMVTYRCHD